MTSYCNTGEVSVRQGPVLMIKWLGICRSGTRACDKGEVSVGQGPELVI